MHKTLVALALVFTALGFTAGCNQAQHKDGENQDESGRSIEEMREESLASIDRTACASAGGEVRQEGMLGLWRCVTPYADAGSACRTSEDCQGRCLADDAATDYNAAPGQATGLCEADDSPFGCFSEIENGVLSPMLCVD